jgi:hypothetical protein
MNDFQKPSPSEPRDEPPANLAVTSLVLGLASFLCSALAGLPAVIYGVISLRRTRVGRGKALTGIALGSVGTVVTIAFLWNALGEVRDAADRTTDMGHLCQVTLSAHNYASSSKDGETFPSADGPVSWRVLLLPQIEQSNLYSRFKLSEPWDSPTNRPLADERVRTYLSARDTREHGIVDTRMRVFTGPETVFPPGQETVKLTKFPDGTSNTIFAVYADERVPWPQPKELAYSKSAPLPAFSREHPTGFIVSMCDGSNRFISNKISEATLRAAITASGKDELGPDW